MKDNNFNIYLNGEPVPVSEDVYRAYYRPIWRVRSLACSHGSCSQPDWRHCPGDCGLCAYRIDGDNPSLDALCTEGKLNPISEFSDPAVVVSKKLFFADLLEAANRIVPNGRRIIELLFIGETDRDIATILSVPRSTLNDQKHRLYSELRKFIKNY